MTDIAGVKEENIKIRTKKKRPDGTDTTRYENFEKWSYRQWAWEFLRRNSEFIAECKRVRNGTDAEKQAVAKQFELKKFKMYSEKYKGASGIPQFSMGGISSWTNLDCDNEEDRLLTIRMSHGQVLVRFNLAPVIKDVKALDKQLRLAERRMKKRLAIYEKLIEKEAAVHKHKAINFGMYIRLLDLLAEGKKPLECAKLIFPSKVNDGRTDQYLRQDVKAPIAAALKLADEGYIYLSILKGRPQGKGIPVEL